MPLPNLQRLSQKHMKRSITPPNRQRKRVRTSSIQDIEENIITKTPSIPSLSQTFRVFSWNINGIQPFLEQSITSYFPLKDTQKELTAPTSVLVGQQRSASLRSFLRRHDWPEILCLQEIKIRADDSKTQEQVRKAVSPENRADDGPAYRVFFTLPRDRFNARGFGGKLYGVCSIIRNDFYSQYVLKVREVQWDLEGRISIIEISDAEQNVDLAIVNIYAVNGTTNSYRDPQTGLEIGTRHDRKLQIHKLLQEECLQYQEKGSDSLVIGDLNVAPERLDGHPNLRTYPQQHVLNRADFNRRFLDNTNEDGLQGVDIWRALKGQEKSYTYYPRAKEWGTSCDRVDLAIASSSLWSKGRILDMQIFNTIQERGPSDHVPFSVTMSVAPQVNAEGSS